jgi:hypothetical protein
VAGAVPEATELAALGRLPRFPALDGGGVHHPEVVGPQRRLASHGPDEGLELTGGGPETLVVAGLVGHVGEQVPKVGLGEAEEPGLRTEAQQGPDDRQRDELGVGELRGDPDDRSVSGQLGTGLQLVVDVHVECRAKGVQIGVHETSKVKWL